MDLLVGGLVSLLGLFEGGSLLSQLLLGFQQLVDFFLECSQACAWAEVCRGEQLLIDAFCGFQHGGDGGVELDLGKGSGELLEGLGIESEPVGI